MFCNLLFLIVAHDTLFTSILNYTRAHFIILQGAFQTLKGRTIQNFSVDESSSKFDQLMILEMNEEMKKCTKHLQIIIE